MSFFFIDAERKKVVAFTVGGWSEWLGLGPNDSKPISQIFPKVSFYCYYPEWAHFAMAPTVQFPVGEMAILSFSFLITPFVHCVHMYFVFVYQILNLLLYQPFI